MWASCILRQPSYFFKVLLAVGLGAHRRSLNSHLTFPEFGCSGVPVFQMAREREATNLHYQILEQEAIKVQVVSMKNMGRWSGGGRKGLPQLGDMGPQDDVPYLIDI